MGLYLRVLLFLVHDESVLPEFHSVFVVRLRLHSFFLEVMLQAHEI